MRVWQKVTKQGRLRSETGECLPGQWLLQAEEHRKPHWPTLVGRGREMCQRGPGCGWSALLVWWLRNSSSSSLGLLWAGEKVYGPHQITKSTPELQLIGGLEAATVLPLLYTEKKVCLSHSFFVHTCPVLLLRFWQHAGSGFVWGRTGRKANFCPSLIFSRVIK